jgi:hypothetical protein
VKTNLAARTMAQLSKSRPLNPKERELLEFILTADFPGRDELKIQTNCAEVCWECDCGCGTVNFELTEPCTRAAAREPIPVEAYRESLEVLLFVREGFLSSLEIVDYLDVRPVTYPSPKELKLGVRPPQRGDGVTSRNDPS